MELPRPLFSPNSINKKKFTPKKFSRKMELSYTNIKKYIYFLKIKLFLYFGKLKHQKKNPYISGNRTFLYFKKRKP